MDLDSLTPQSQIVLNRFRQRLPQRLEVDAILGLLPHRKLEGKVLLDIGMPNPVMSGLLRECGGTWVTLARSPQNASEASEFLNDEVSCLGAGGEIPFEQHTFDFIVVALGMLTAMRDPDYFIKECNRVLKPSGALIISVQYRKRMSLINFFRKKAAEGHSSLLTRAYTGRGLFGFLKNGFDVIEEEYFSRFFVELVRIRDFKLFLTGHDEMQICKQLGWKYKLADQLDFFNFWNKGYVITVHARRRQWRERTLPVLADGRKIQEAVLTLD